MMKALSFRVVRRLRNVQTSRYIEAASAYVRLYTKEPNGRRDSIRAGEQLTDFGQRINGLAKKLAIAGGAIAAPLVASIKAYVDLGLNCKTYLIGLEFKSMHYLSYVSQPDQSGSNITSLEKALRKMQVAIAEAANGSKSAQQALAAMGLESKDLSV